MANFTVDEFVSQTIAWAASRRDRFRYNFPVKGGWEAWIQVDLCAFILARNSTYDILREQGIFTTPAKRADLLLNAQLAAVQRIPVEMKSESFENHGNFVGGVSADLAKIGNERTPAYSQSSCVNLAVAFSPGNLNAVLALQPAGHRVFKSIWQSDEVAVCAAVWTYPGGWVAS